MKKLTKYMTGILLGAFLLGTTAFAAEVTSVSGIGYTTADTEVKTEASETGVVFLTKEQCPDNIPLLITGITDNGYWEVDLGQENKFYIIGAGLVNINGSGEQTTEQTAGVEGTNAAVVNDVPEEAVNGMIEEYKYYERKNPTTAEIQEMQECYKIFMQAVNKLLNGTTNVTYYSDDTLMPYSDEVVDIVDSYFRHQYPNFTVGGSHYVHNGYAYAEKYVSDWTITWG